MFRLYVEENNLRKGEKSNAKISTKDIFRDYNFIYSNDNYKDVFNELKEAAESKLYKKDSATASAGVFVGAAHFLSLAPTYKKFLDIKTSRKPNYGEPKSV